MRKILKKRLTNWNRSGILLSNIILIINTEKRKPEVNPTLHFVRKSYGSE